MVFKGRRSGIIHNWTMALDTGYKFEEEIVGGIIWFMMGSKDFI